MPTITLTVAGINAPKPNGKKSKIVGTNNEAVYAFPDKAAKFTLGRTYEIDCSTSEYNGKMLNHLESFTEVEAAKAPATTSSASPTAAAFRTPEQSFLSDMLVAMVTAGQVGNDKEQLWKTTKMLRGLWQHGICGTGAFLASEAGRQQAA